MIHESDSEQGERRTRRQHCESAIHVQPHNALIVGGGRSSLHFVLSVRELIVSPDLERILSDSRAF